MTALRIIYDGPALRTHQMDVKDLAPALLAIGELLETANELVNGPKTIINVQVSASFKAGSFGIDLTVGNLVQQALQLVGLDGYSAKQILEWLGLAGNVGKAVGGISAGVIGVIQLIKFINGRSIKKVEILSNGRVRIVVDDGQIEVEEKVLLLFRNFKLREALENAVKPLEKEGIDTFAASINPEESFEVIDKSEFYLFSSPKSDDEKVSDQIITRNLQFVNVAFKDDAKWKFTDGGSTFFATILDEEFIIKINNNTPITKGDVIFAEIRETQWLRGEDLKSEYEILKVLEHRRGGQQLVLPLIGSQNPTE